MSNKFIDIFGQQFGLLMDGLLLTIPDWARIYGLTTDTLRGRIKRGLTLEEAIKYGS